jgi:hypothetical protein
VLGCDTTSRLYGIGKGVSLKKIKSSHLFREQANVFAAQSFSKEDGAASEENVMVSLYNVKPGVSLDSLQHKR